MRLAKKYNQGGKPLTPFQKAFAKARDEGKETFMFEGEEYTTRTEEEEYSKYIQPGGPGTIDDILNSPEAIAKRKYEEEWLASRNDPTNPSNWATGAAKPMEGLDDPVFNVLLGARMLQKPAQHALRTALGPKYNPLNPQYNLNAGARGLSPQNVYERAATEIGRYGTRDIAGGNQTVVNRIADFVSENLPAFLRSR
tara:strand:+ start:8063 stop:8653 length:591 start_codon:yes stop_codon:yes gene_type:complete